MNALILENSSTYRQLLSNLLAKYGIESVSASSKSKGLEFAEATAFDLICVSMYLEDATGIEFAQELRQKKGKSNIPIYMLTSTTDDSIRVKSLQNGITEVFSKNKLEKLSEYISEFTDNNVLGNLQGARVLYIEDSRSVALVTTQSLEQLDLHVAHFSRADSAFEEFQKAQNYDLVITDIVVEGTMSGLALVRAIRGLEGQLSQIPIIAISGHDDQSRRIELFRAGVNDYVTKPIVNEELHARVRNLISNKKLIDRVRLQQTRLQDLALRDSLTGCNNRHYLTELAPRFIAEAKRHHHELCLLIIDLDHFKNINDTRGHIVGDVVLSEVGKLLTRTSRESDLVVRFGGEEFVILLPYCDVRLGKKKAEQVRKTIEDLNPDGIPISASIGITSLATSEANDFDEMFRVADKAVYLAKENGRNRVEMIKKLDDVNKGDKNKVA